MTENVWAVVATAVASSIIFLYWAVSQGYLSLGLRLRSTFGPNVSDDDVAQSGYERMSTPQSDEDLASLLRSGQEIGITGASTWGMARKDASNGLSLQAATKRNRVDSVKNVLHQFGVNSLTETDSGAFIVDQIVLGCIVPELEVLTQGMFKEIAHSAGIPKPFKWVRVG